MKPRHLETPDDGSWSAELRPSGNAGRHADPHLCCHHAIRTLMWEAADHANVDPDRVSFVAALRIARRSISAARDLSPSAN